MGTLRGAGGQGGPARGPGAPGGVPGRGPFPRLPSRGAPGPTRALDRRLWIPPRSGLPRGWPIIRAGAEGGDQLSSPLVPSRVEAYRSSRCGPGRGNWKEAQLGGRIGRKGRKSVELLALAGLRAGRGRGWNRARRVRAGKRVLRWASAAVTGNNLPHSAVPRQKFKRCAARLRGRNEIAKRPSKIAMRSLHVRPPRPRGRHPRLDPGNRAGRSSESGSYWPECSGKDDRFLRRLRINF